MFDKLKLKYANWKKNKLQKEIEAEETPVKSIFAKTEVEIHPVEDSIKGPEKE